MAKWPDEQTWVENSRSVRPFVQLRSIGEAYLSDVVLDGENRLARLVVFAREFTRNDSMRIKITPRYLVAFAALTLLCGTSHEFAHHFAAAGICGEFGYKTFNSFKLADGCEYNPWRLWATAAGPILTFGLMWWGAKMLLSGKLESRGLGFALVFANFPVNRMLFALLGFNDEQWIAQQMYGDSRMAFWVTSVLVWVACVPPLVVAYRAMDRRRRPLWFAAFFLLPFVFVLLFAGFFLEEFLLLKHHVLATPLLGIPLLVLLVEVVSLLIYHALRNELKEGPAVSA